jgi:alkanesulfonate monooxygenase SsuD/methylene tetrahydromethanopterin reductase-like flavin-dependent oxidoreductase (luciferase family)
VDANGELARERAARFLGATYSQDFRDFIDRVTVAGTLESVVQGLVAFVRAGARHLVVLPCQDPERRSDLVPPWLPELLAGVRSAEA